MQTKNFTAKCLNTFFAHCRLSLPQQSKNHYPTFKSFSSYTDQWLLSRLLRQRNDWQQNTNDWRECISEDRRKELVSTLYYWKIIDSAVVHRYWADWDATRFRDGPKKRLSMRLAHQQPVYASFFHKIWNKVFTDCFFSTVLLWTQHLCWILIKAVEFKSGLRVRLTFRAQKAIIVWLKCWMFTLLIISMTKF